MCHLTDDLIRAAEAPDTPVHLNQLLIEAGLCITRLEMVDFYDQCRLNFLEDLGEFSFDKKDGEDITLTIKMSGRHYFCSTAPTVRQAVDLAVEECRAAKMLQDEPLAAERAKFEAWIGQTGKGGSLKRGIDGDYKDTAIDFAWQGWWARAKETAKT